MQVTFVKFNNPITNMESMSTVLIQISKEIVFKIWTQGRKMVGADRSTELR